MSDRLIVLLGNPGRDYAHTRHNAAWLAAEAWFPDLPWQGKFQGRWAAVPWQGRRLILLKPETFMNEAGRSAQAARAFFKLELNQVVAVHDDLELPFGEVRAQWGGGLQGHNGLRSLKQHLGGDQFGRLRLGIGRPERGEVASFVLSRFRPDEEVLLGGFWGRALEALGRLGGF